MLACCLLPHQWTERSFGPDVATATLPSPTIARAHLPAPPPPPERVGGLRPVMRGLRRAREEGVEEEEKSTRSRLAPRYGAIPFSFYPTPTSSAASSSSGFSAPTLQPLQPPPLFPSSFAPRPLSPLSHAPGPHQHPREEEEDEALSTLRDWQRLSPSECSQVSGGRARLPPPSRITMS